MLYLKGVSAYYGNLHILKKISLHVGEGEIVALLGANGAGKSTLLKTLMGILFPKGGEILFQNQKIEFLSTEERVRLGLSLVPEGKGLFKPLSVEENLLLGTYTWYNFKKKKEFERKLEEIYALFPILKTKRKAPAGTLSGGQQQILAIARAFMSNPKLLLLDEPSMGIAPNLVLEIFQYIQNLRENYNLSILLVEQNARLALKIADRVYVMETGKIIYEGEAKNALENPEIQRAYLGREVDREAPL
ncbi:amino acid ABC transporter ATPase [Caldimicrobium thiodismutans]|uniref:Amino acid ABC transporter ATPase n=1 Tax=Caldimicrobium thiodismutans TaxID=1653476 RepID=A0A0U4N3G7_9BACT|nr:ABC transporter ATP-binding protein [Caldimicrobium thiodismutans]BAU23830.1 amino acid ABC transporter ATPase [Caldimicrobium thiodismutans]